ncbi:MAG: LacI family DNA-binding transcriptional regulator, partial [Hyphomonadaceae bacterium]
MAKKKPLDQTNQEKTVVTSYDVARRAGVSQSAVSRAFRKGASVAPATRARIVEAAQALGYEPNAIAQG